MFSLAHSVTSDDSNGFIQLAKESEFSAEIVGGSITAVSDRCLGAMQEPRPHSASTASMSLARLAGVSVGA